MKSRKTSCWTIRRWSKRAAIFAALLAAQPLIAVAGSDIITVGVSGLSNNCTVATVQEAIDLAEDRGGPQVIWITRDVDGTVWTNQALYVTDQDVDLVGGFDDCHDTEPSGHTFLSGSGGARAPVLRIRGSGVVNLRGLAIIEGDATAGGDAGGIDYRGNGSLNIESSIVQLNAADSHDVSGIDFEGAGGQAFLGIRSGVLIADNLGGGMEVSGTATLTMYGDLVFVWNNGGMGVAVLSPANADIGLSSHVFEGVFHNNAGPGLFASTNGQNSGSSVVRLFSIDAARPLAFTGNAGPAILVNSRDAGSAEMKVCAKDIRIGNHVVPVISHPANGGHLVSVEGEGAKFAMNVPCDYPTVADIVCAPQGLTHCGLIHNNQVPSARALLAAIDGGEIEIERARIVDNDTTAVLHTKQADESPVSHVRAKNLLIDRNDIVLAPIDVNRGGILVATNLTISGNRGDFFTFRGDGPGFLSVSASIADQEQRLLAGGGDKLLTQLVDVLAPNTDGTTVNHRILLGRPDFQPGTYRLSPFSPGIDIANAIGGVDIDGNPRDVDDPFTPNVEGPRDLGAFETQSFADDRIFADGFD